MMRKHMFLFLLSSREYGVFAQVVGIKSGGWVHDIDPVVMDVLEHGDTNRFEEVLKSYS